MAVSLPRRAMNQSHGYQFALFRILLALYLAVHFAQLLPYAEELFSRGGVVANPAVNPTHGLLPNPLEHWDSPAFAVAFIAGLFALALGLAFGFCRRIVSLFLWYGWACLLNRNCLISNPSISYVGCLLLMCALIPAGEPLSVAGRASGWHWPHASQCVVWWLVIAGHTYSGWYKLRSPSWIDGSAMVRVLQNPLARTGPVRDWLLHGPPWSLQWLTWSALAVEIAALPLGLFRQTRLFVWIGLVALHLSILAVMCFADLTVGMLLPFLFSFQHDWVPERWRETVKACVDRIGPAAENRRPRGADRAIRPAQ